MSTFSVSDTRLESGDSKNEWDMVPALKRLSLTSGRSSRPWKLFLCWQCWGHGWPAWAGSSRKVVTWELLRTLNPWCLNMGSLWIRWGPPNRGDDCVEAGGAGGERIHLKQNTGDRSVLTAPQGSHGQDSRGEAVYHEAVGGDCF